MITEITREFQFGRVYQPARQWGKSVLSRILARVTRIVDSILIRTSRKLHCHVNQLANEIKD